MHVCVMHVQERQKQKELEKTLLSGAWSCCNPISYDFLFHQEMCTCKPRVVVKPPRLGLEPWLAVWESASFAQ